MLQTSRTGKQSGFTLLELLLAVTLGAVVLSAVYGTYTTVLDANRRISRVATDLQAWRFFSERLRSDLKNLAPQNRQHEYSVIGDSNTLTLQLASKPGAPARVRYEPHKTTSGLQIRRSAIDNEEETVSDNPGTVVYSDANELTFRFLTDGEWLAETGKNLPLAIECTLVHDGRRQIVVIALEVESMTS